jgi:hypothetical protein
MLKERALSKDTAIQEYRKKRSLPQIDLMCVYETSVSGAPNENRDCRTCIHDNHHRKVRPCGQCVNLSEWVSVGETPESEEK